MTLGLCFWIIMLIWLVVGGWSVWPNLQAAAPNILLFVLLLLLGWQTFGAPIRG